MSLVEDGSGAYTHAEKINSFIKKGLADAGISFSELNGVAVSEGPGSYTGLRIGVSAAKGVAYALELPLIAINTLQAMSTEVVNGNPNDLFIPMIDARRMEVFCSGFSGDGRTVFSTRAEILTEDSFPEAKQFERVFYFGDGASKCQEILTPLGFDIIKDIQASARGMVLPASRSFSKGDFVDRAYFEPFYLKDFVAGKKKKST